MGDLLVSVMLPGAPRGKGRPRFRIVKPKGKPQFVTVYTDKETVEYEAALAKEGAAAMGATAPFEGALTAYVEAFVPIPDSWPRKKREDAAAGRIFPTGKPDGDNYAKCAGDALNKIVWADDSQIVMWQVLKVYSHTPGLRVSVWAWDDVPAQAPELDLIGE